VTARRKDDDGKETLQQFLNTIDTTRMVLVG
jgi:hypothetical protein